MRTARLPALRPLVVLAALAALLPACGSASEAEQACEDLADALADGAQRCGFDYDANYDAVVEVAAGGDCGNIKQIRDKASFYDDCIPFVRKLTCEQLHDSSLQLPASCNAQLVR